MTPSDGALAGFFVGLAVAALLALAGDARARSRRSRSERPGTGGRYKETTHPSQALRKPHTPPAGGSGVTPPRSCAGCAPTVNCAVRNYGECAPKPRPSFEACGGCPAPCAGCFPRA